LYGFATKSSAPLSSACVRAEGESSAVTTMMIGTLSGLLEVIPHAPDQGDAVHGRHHPVREEGIERLTLDACERLRPVLDHGDLVARILQGDLEEHGTGRIVFGDENLHSPPQRPNICVHQLDWA
jgi:hypothetical protein